jgi:hypothetical protein
MRKVRLSCFVFLAAIFSGLAVSAGATTVTITAGPFSTVSGADSSSFDNGLPAGYAAPAALAGVRTGSLQNVYLTPSGDTTPYAYVGLTLTDSNGVSMIYGPGGTPVSGLVTDQTTSVYVNSFDAGARAFECDNVPIVTSAPEPVSIFLLAGSLLAIGAIRRRAA